MAVSIEQIKQLRDATGVSMTACKKALEEADGDYDKAVELLRKKGEAKAADRAERGTGEGAVIVSVEEGRAAMIQLGCETDFVARSPEFAELGSGILADLLAGKISSDDRELEVVKEAVLRLGENIQVLNMVLVEGPVLGSYVHSNGKIGVVVVLDGASSEIARDVAMHAAATGPAVLSPDEVSDELVAKEKDIWTEQLKAEGKPEEIIEKIMMGKEKKFREESALIKQSFVKNPEQTVEQFVAEAGAKVLSFVRFSV